MLELGKGGHASEEVKKFKPSREKFVPVEEIDDFRIGLGEQTVVVATGAFDLLHEDHADFLEIAKSQGDVLIVIVDSDEKVSRKGPNRPLRPQANRARLIAALGCVDYVVQPLPGQEAKTFESLKPTYCASGNDYTYNTLSRDFREVFERRNIPVIFIGAKTISTTLLIDRAVQKHTPLPA